MGLPLPRRGSELVISMTIAEMFLLLVFMVWYSSIKDPAPGPRGGFDACQEENKRLERENVKLKVRNTSLAAELDDVQQSLKYWQAHFGQYPPRTDSELAKFRQELGRGKPKCQEDNLLVEVRIVRGDVAIELLRESPELQRVAGTNRDMVAVGNVLRSENDVSSLFKYVRETESSGGQNGKGCRFDYRFVWATDTDFRVGVEKLEALFYSVGRRKFDVVGGLDQ
jgi:hypothetical protein